MPNQESTVSRPFVWKLVDGFHLHLVTVEHDRGNGERHGCQEEAVAVVMSAVGSCGIKALLDSFGARNNIGWQLNNIWSHAVCHPRISSN